MSLLSLLKLNITGLFFLVMTTLLLIDILTLLGFSYNYKIKNKYAKIICISLFCLFSLIIYYFIIWAFYIHEWTRVNENIIHMYQLSGIVVITYVPKVIYLLFYFIQLLVSLFKFLLKIFFKKNINLLSKNNAFLNVGIFISLFSFLFLIYGTVAGRFHYEITHQKLVCKSLPELFNNFKIVQISDIHISTYYNHEKELNKLIKLVNDQNPDVIFFTGDLINNFSEEVKPFIPILEKLSAKYGKFAIFGNHDYGDYYRWKNDSLREENHKILINSVKSAGFKLLLNENTVIRNQADSIIIAGTENWGPLPYRQAGDLTKTLKGTNANNFILLLSHDPSVWDKFVKSHPNIIVTFSGHTHGMQIGINCCNFYWTPFHMRYKRWIGLYKENDQYLYVNRGIGAGLYSGRIGMWPEISVFELKKK